jgi:hypothetical protein
VAQCILGLANCDIFNEGIVGLLRLPEGCGYYVILSLSLQVADSGSGRVFIECIIDGLEGYAEDIHKIFVSLFAKIKFRFLERIPKKLIR